jgi:hypothetical protein
MFSESRQRVGALARQFQLSRFRVQPRNLLKARMKITAYNLHGGSFRSEWFSQKLKFTRCSFGAVVVIQSNARVFTSEPRNPAGLASEGFLRVLCGEFPPRKIFHLTPPSRKAPTTTSFPLRPVTLRCMIPAVIELRGSPVEGPEMQASQPGYFPRRKPVSTSAERRARWRPHETTFRERRVSMGQAWGRFGFAFSMLLLTFSIVPPRVRAGI